MKVRFRSGRMLAAGARVTGCFGDEAEHGLPCVRSDVAPEHYNLPCATTQTQRLKLILLRAEKFRANRKPQVFCS